VSPLIRRYLRILTVIVPERRVCAAHHLEIGLRHPTFVSFGFMLRRQTLSFHIGVARFSDTNSQASGSGPTHSIHSIKSASAFGGITTNRLDESVFGQFAWPLV
jgi:hypothetical protein